jgi:hypothetical protein
MAFCTKCGNQNSDTTKFCIRCGNALIKPVPQSPAPVPAIENSMPDVIQNTPSKQKSKWLLPGIIGLALALTGTLSYYLFIKKDENKSEVHIVQSDTVTVVTPANNTANPASNTGQSTAVNTTETYAGPLLQQNGSSSISDEEIQVISQSINNLYTAENSKNYTTALSFFSFPVSKYYNFSNLSYQQMYDVYLQSDAKLTYHENAINISNSFAEKTSYGYRLTMLGEYKFATVKNPDSVRTNVVRAELLLNNDYKIFSVGDVR